MHFRKYKVIVMKPLDYLCHGSLRAAYMKGLQTGLFHSQYASLVAAFCTMGFDELFQVQQPCEIILMGDARDVQISTPKFGC